MAKLPPLAGLLLVLILAACADLGSDPFSRGDPDVLDDDDLAGDDDDEATDDDDDDVALETAGSVALHCFEFPDDDWVIVRRCRFEASFWRLLERGEPGTGGVSITSPAGPDTCALTVWDEADTVVEGGTPSRTDAMSAGELTLTDASWAAPLPPDDDGAGSITYALELDGDHPAHFGEPYAVEAEGEEFPPFDSSDTLRLPGAIHLAEPAPTESFSLPDGDLAVRWGGASEPTVWLELHNETVLTTGNAQITCEVVNDGAFDVPADLVAQLPPDALRLVLGQPVSGSFEVGGFAVGVGSGSSVEARGDGG